MSLKTVNLNLAPVLRELLRTRSVSETGKLLGRSPSAISEALSQLRVLFNDPLLVRAQGGMTLTPRAVSLIDTIEALCAHAEDVFEPARVDPLKTNRCFTIAAHDYHVYTRGPQLLGWFRNIAPMITLRFIDLGPDLGRQLNAREVDFALMPDFYCGELASSRLEYIALPGESGVAIMRPDHPLAALELIDQEALASVEQVAFQPAWEPAGYRRLIAAAYRHTSVCARVSQITAIPQFIIGTDYVAQVPRALAERLCPIMGLIYRSITPEPPGVRPVLAWSGVQSADVVHQWFREQVAIQFECWKAPSAD